MNRPSLPRPHVLMPRTFRRLTVSSLLLVAALTLGVGCGGKSTKGGIPHTNYGGCQIQGRHYHNTHVFIGDEYNASLTEWLKY